MAQLHFRLQAITIHWVVIVQKGARQNQSHPMLNSEHNTFLEKPQKIVGAWQYSIHLLAVDAVAYMVTSKM